MKQKSLSNSYLSSLCMELHMVLNAGITLSDGVPMLLEDEPDRDGKTVLRSLCGPLERGETLSEAFRESGFFPRYVVEMAETGEKTGRLTETLRALSEHYDRQDRLADTIKSAVLYPAILLVMMVAVVLVLIVRVLPIFKDVFNSLGAQMSPLAVRLMQLGGWLGDASAIIAVIFGLVFAALLLAWLVPPLRKTAVRAFQNAFGDRGLLGNIAASRFISVLALASASGLDTSEAVEMAAAVSGGAKGVDEKHRKCVQLLGSGGTLADSMHRAGILSARDGRMLSLGARSGMIDAAMSEIAGRSERAVQSQIERIVGKVEPALVIITSVIVGIILLSVMLPLMSIMTSIG